MTEYYDIEEQIEKALEEPAVRGFFGLSHTDTMEKALPLLMNCYRQRQVKLVLQGRENELPELPIESANVDTVRHFLDANSLRNNRN